MTDASIPFIEGTPYTERMMLVVRGQVYDRWTSARVTLQVDAPFQEFQFSTSEPIDTHHDWDDWHIRNGDPVEVYVGGILVVRGLIDIREAFYDAHQHAVMLYGRDYNCNAYESAVRMGSGQGEVQLINATFTQIMQRALQGSGTSIEAPGDDGTIFPNFSISFGETPWNVGERTKRYIPALRITSDPIRPVWIAETMPLGGGGATFIEGENILSARAVIDTREWVALDHTMGQQPNRDERSVEESNHVEGMAADGSLPATAQNRYYAIALEDPANKKMAEGRASHDLIKRAEEIIHCEIKVYSWFERSGQLFRIRAPYTVHSPMLGMNNNPLWSRTVVFEQSEAGSTTTITLSSKSALHPFFRGPEHTGVGALPTSNNYVGQGVLASELERSWNV